MSEGKMEKYPRILLGTDGSYQMFISNGVEVKFESEEDINEFVKDKNFEIVGVKESILTKKVNKNMNLIFETLYQCKQ